MLAAPYWVAVPLVVPCGVLIGMLFVIGHDASHNSYTRNRGLNQTIARIAFLPSLHACALWDLAHNRTHHIWNNLRGVDYVWEPKTAASYRELGAVRRGFYRLCRTPAGVTLYYLVAIWAMRLIVPWPAVVRTCARGVLGTTACWH